MSPVAKRRGRGHTGRAVAVDVVGVAVALGTAFLVANLANTPRAGTVQVPGFAGARVTDVFGGGEFPAIGPDGGATFTFGARDFFWLALTPVAPVAEPAAAVAAPSTASGPITVAAGAAPAVTTAGSPSSAAAAPGAVEATTTAGPPAGATGGRTE